MDKTTMKLWLIQRNDNLGWDEHHGYVIEAETEQRAREVAGENAFTEGSKIWFASTTTCTELTVTGREQIILTDCQNG